MYPISIFPSLFSDVDDVDTTYSSQFTTNSSKFRRYLATDSSYYFNVVQIVPRKTGLHFFRSRSDIQLYGYLYKDQFDATAASNNLQTFDDQSRNINQFLFITTLQTDTIYYLVVTTAEREKTGTFTVSISSNDYVDLTPINCMFSESLKLIHQVIHFFSSLDTAVLNTTTYSSSLTSNSFRYRRHLGLPNVSYYYELIRVTPSMPGNYSFRSISDADLVGYLYGDNFVTTAPATDLIKFDDQSGNNSQFLITANLIGSQSYYLVVTTSIENQMGSFSVVSAGPGYMEFYTIDGKSVHVSMCTITSI